MEISTSKSGVTSWAGVKQNMIEKAKARLQKYGAFDDDGDVDLSKLGINRFAPVNRDGSIDKSRNVMNIRGLTV